CALLSSRRTVVTSTTLFRPPTPRSPRRCWGGWPTPPPPTSSTGCGRAWPTRKPKGCPPARPTRSARRCTPASPRSPPSPPRRPRPPRTPTPKHLTRGDETMPAPTAAARVAARKILAERVTSEYEAARADAAPEFARLRTQLGVKSLDVLLPGGASAGTISIKAGARIVDWDEAALADYAEANAPDEVVETV